MFWPTRPSSAGANKQLDWSRSIATADQTTMRAANGVLASASELPCAEMLFDMNHTRPALLDAAAVIFDVDGTLVDSVDFHAEAWQKAFAAFGFDFDVVKIRSQIGKGGDQLMPVFLDADILERQGRKIEAFRQDLFEREYFHRVVGFPHVPELFRFLIKAGKTIALGVVGQDGRPQGLQEGSRDRGNDDGGNDVGRRRAVEATSGYFQHCPGTAEGPGREGDRRRGHSF